MWQIGRITAGVALAGTVAGCATGGAFPATSLTNVELSDENYTVVATDVIGTASAGYILGFSGFGSTMRTLAVARVEGDGQLYGAALQDLWGRFEEDYGSVAGRSLGLVNVRFDSDALNLILYTKATVWVRADVVEFGS